MYRKALTSAALSTMAFFLAKLPVTSSSDALFKVCTRVLRHSVPLPLRPDSFILTPQLLDDMAMGSKRVD